MLILCSCAGNKADKASTDEDNDSTENEAFAYDKQLLCVKGRVKSVTYGTEFNRHIFFFNKKGEIIAWYNESKVEYDAPMVKMPVVFERDADGKIVKASIEEAVRTLDDVHSQTNTSEFIYDKEGRLNKIKESTGLEYTYDNYNDYGAPTNTYSNPSDKTKITYSKSDDHDNWLLVTHSGYTDKVYERTITYYDTFESNDFAEAEAKKYKQAIKDIPQIIEKEKARLQEDYDSLGDGEDYVGYDYDQQDAGYASGQSSQGSQQVNYDQAILNELQSIQNEISSLQSELNEYRSKYSAACIKYGTTNMSTMKSRMDYREALNRPIRLAQKGIINANELSDPNLRQQYASQFQRLYDYYNGIDDRVHREGMPH